MTKLRLKNSEVDLSVDDQVTCNFCGKRDAVAIRSHLPACFVYTRQETELRDVLKVRHRDLNTDYYRKGWRGEDMRGYLLTREDFETEWVELDREVITMKENTHICFNCAKQLPALIKQYEKANPPSND